MELALACKELWARKLLLLVGVAVSIFAAALSIYRISLLPPGYQSRNLVYSGAYTQALVDSPRSFLGDFSQQVEPLIARATVYANLMASPAVVELIGKYAGIPSNQIWAAGPVDPSLQRAVIEPTATKRNVQIAGEPDPYRLEFLADPNLPTVGIYSQAPTTTKAVVLANASVRAITDYVQMLQDQQQVGQNARVSIRQIGAAVGSVVDSGITKKLAGLVFFLSFFAWCILVLIGIRLRASFRVMWLFNMGRSAAAPADREARPFDHQSPPLEREPSAAPDSAEPEKQLIGAGPARR